jgi:Ca2+-binding EF-hand superfamily protein
MGSTDLIHGGTVIHRSSFSHLPYAGVPFHLPRPPRQPTLHEQVVRDQKRLQQQEERRLRQRGQPLHQHARRAPPPPTIVYKIKSNDKFAIDSIHARRRLTIAPRALRPSSSSPSLAGFDEAASLPGRPRVTDLSNYQPMVDPNVDGRGFEHDGVSDGTRKRLGFADVPSRYRAFRAAWDAKHEAQHHEEAATMLRQQAMAFSVADASGDGQLDFKEFKSLIASEMKGQDVGKDQLKAWFQSIDTDNSGQISMSEFFVFALQEALVRSGAEGGLLGFFQHWDKSGDATLDRAEFIKMAQRLGWGDAVSSIIRTVDHDHSGKISYQEMIDSIKGRGEAHQHKEQKSFRQAYTAAKRVGTPSRSPAPRRGGHQAKVAASPSKPPHGGERQSPNPPRQRPSPPRQRAPVAIDDVDLLGSWLWQNFGSVQQAFIRMDADGDYQLGMRHAVTPRTHDLWGATYQATRLQENLTLSFDRGMPVTVP